MQLGCNNIYSIGSRGATNSRIGEKKSLGSFGKELCVLCNFLVTFCIKIFILLTVVQRIVTLATAGNTLPYATMSIQ